MRFVVLAVVLALTPAVASAAGQFDLVCTGSVKTTGGGPSAWSQRFSIDLDAGAYCQQPCEGVSPIQKVTPGSLTLWEVTDRNSDGRGGEAVDRITGKFVGWGEATGQSTRATCAVAPFTPMPKRLF